MGCCTICLRNTWGTIGSYVRNFPDYTVVAPTQDLVGTCGRVYRYEAQLEKEWQFIINDSGAKMLLVGPDSIYLKTKSYIGQVNRL